MWLCTFYFTLKEQKSKIWPCTDGAIESEN
jgi:hypothetical protein